MRLTLLQKMRCVGCNSPSLQAITEQSHEEYVLDGTVKCIQCGILYRIKDGILILKIHDRDVLREKSQWEQFAKTEGWLEKNELYLEALPSAGANFLMHKDTIGWLTHEYNFFTMLKILSLKGKSVLDFGAGRCWSSKWMAMKGAEVVAFDALEHPTIGLGAGAVFLKNHDIYFDRVCGDFNELPFQDETFDIVVSTGSMHHSNNLSVTIGEVARILKTGGSLAIMNEPVRSFRSLDETVKLKGDQEGINEHEYRMTRYLSLFRRHGLKIGRIHESVLVYNRGSAYYGGILASLINRTLWGRLLNLVLCGGVMNILCYKPGQKN